MSDWERDEWWAAVVTSTAAQQAIAIDEPRRAIGIIGDREDARDG